jgi:hypothetical protein
MASPRRSSLRSTALGALTAFALVAAVEARAEAAEKITYPAACTEVKPSEAEEARKSFVEGKTKSEQALYAEALSAYLTAYRKDCSRHGFLQVISGVLERQGEYDEAVRALELYLARQNLAPADRAPIETRVANLRTAAEEKRKKAASEAPKPGVTPPPETKTEVVTVREHTAGPWVVMAGGVVAIATGIVLHAAAPDIPQSCDGASQNCQVYDKDGNVVPLQQRTPAQNNQLETDRAQAATSVDMRKGGTGTIIGGAVLVVGGLLWHFLEPTGPVEKTSSLPRPVPVIGSGYGGLVLGGRF